MNRFDRAARTAASAAITALDFSMFAPRDVANIALHRSEVLLDIPDQADALRAWARGDDGPILHVARTHRAEIVSRAVAFVFLEYRALRPLLRRIAPRRIADIGCGYGLFDLFAHAEFGSELLLIDTETSAERHVRYSGTGAACADLDTARRFLVANGCDAGRIRCVNPDRAPLQAHGGFDLAVSLLACGFMFPASAYGDFLARGVVPGGSAILDLRTRRAPENLADLAPLGEVHRIGPAADGKALRVHLAKHAGARADAGRAAA